jgi:hypothetical protein
MTEEHEILALSGEISEDDDDEPCSGSWIFPRYHCFELRDFVRKTVFATTATVLDVLMDESPIFIDDRFAEFVRLSLAQPGVCIHERTLRHLVCSMKSALVRYRALHQYPDSSAQRSLVDEFDVLVGHCKALYERHIATDERGNVALAEALGELETRSGACGHKPADAIHAWAAGCVQKLVDEGRIPSHDATGLRKHYEAAMEDLWERFVRGSHSIYDVGVSGPRVRVDGAER